MKKITYLTAFILVILSFTSCTNDDSNNEPYTTGVIKFEYNKSTTIKGKTTTKDTIVSFTSTGNNPNEKDVYGFSEPLTPWVQMMRLNPNNFENRAIIFFTGTNLNTLTFPYKFKTGDTKDAQINYVVDETLFYDNSGMPYSRTNAYASTTQSEKFELTILSRENNRLKGSFNGELINQDGLILNIKNGLFDITIVEKSKTFF